MKVGDLESWFSEWNRLAADVERMGTSAEASGHKITAMQSYFRASNYYRMADFYLDRNDPKERPTYLKHVSVFQKAASLHLPSVETISIPFDGRELHGYFVETDKSPERTEMAPCIIIFGGADATCNEAYFSSAAEASMRGVHALLMAGPGRAGARR